MAEAKHRCFMQKRYSNRQINSVGEILKDPNSPEDHINAAEFILNQWRSEHAYPINTFQATLRNKLKKIAPKAIVAQRLKRTPSILAKLRTRKTMELIQMQDIGGLRAVVANLTELRLIEKSYEGARFKHKCRKKDYIIEPKPSGYRCLHLSYTYSHAGAPRYDGLKIELQLRTKLQHSWATAVETAGTFLGQALKSSEGEQRWLDFFSLAGSAFSILEGGPAVPGYEQLTAVETYERTVLEARKLNVVKKLKAFTLAVSAMTENRAWGTYHVLVLTASRRSLSYSTYQRSDLARATEQYRYYEGIHKGNPDIQVVLVAADSLSALKRAYPNYFLNTEEFVQNLILVRDTFRTLKFPGQTFIPHASGL